MSVEVCTRYTAECYECGYVSPPMMDTREADDLAREHICPKPHDSEETR